MSKKKQAMRRFIYILLILPVFVFGQATEDSIATYIDSKIPDNTTGSITPADLRDVFDLLNISKSSGQSADYDHLFGYFGDSTVTFTITTQDTWYHLSNATDSLYRYAEVGNFTVTEDTIIFPSTEYYDLSCVLTFEGSANQDYKLRFYNVTQATGIPVGQSTTGQGAGDAVQIHIQSHWQVNANDRVILQFANDDNTGDATLRSSNILIEYAHD